MVSTLFGPYMGSKLNPKWLMMIGGLCYTFNYFTGFLITHFPKIIWLVYGVVVFGAALAGASASLLWISQGNYMHTICENNHKQAEKGYYFGVFFRLYTVSNILAGVTTTFLLGFFSPRIYFIIITSLGLFSVLYLFFFLENIRPGTKHKERQSLLTDNEEELTPSSLPVQSSKFDPLAVFRFNPRMWVMLSFIGVVGLVIGFYTSELAGLIEVTLPHNSSPRIHPVKIRYRHYDPWCG